MHALVLLGGAGTNLLQVLSSFLVQSVACVHCYFPLGMHCLAMLFVAGGCVTIIRETKCM